MNRQLRLGVPTRAAIPLALVACVWLSLPAAAALAQASLRAGTARADVTPPLGGQMYGYGARGDNVSTGVHDALQARALVLELGDTRLGIVNLDLGSFGKPYADAVRRQVRDATGIEQVLLVASHSHSAPRFDETFPTAEHPWLRDLETSIAGAVIEASRQLAPATLRFGRGELDGCHNRRRVHADGTVEMLWEDRSGEPTTPIDRSVQVLALDGEDGRAIATLVNFACHPVVLGPENLEISADYPGAMMAAVEYSIGGQAMFLQGAAGDINPNWDKTPLADGAFARMRELGAALAGEVLRIRPGAQPQAVDRLVLERRQVTLAPRWDLDSPEVRGAYERAGGTRLYEYYRSRFALEKDTEITTVLLGENVALGFFPGEFFVEHGLRFKRESLVPNTLFVGYTNGELGYFPTIRAAAEGGYGAKEATLVEVGAGEMLVGRALIQLSYQLGKLRAVPELSE